MTTVKDVLAYIETLAPGYMKESWDNVGLLCGDPNCPVHKILVALDPFESVCYEAHDLEADLIVTHHPLIFQPLKSITTQTAVGRSILFLCEKGISAINAHTNLDCAPGGVNDTLASRLGLQEVAVVEPGGVDANGESWGLLRTGIWDGTLADFLTHVKQALGAPALRYCDGGKPVHQVAVGGGACAGELMAAWRAGCDTFVTADVRYNQFWDAADLGMNLIDAGHFYTENPVCAVLAEKLRAAFPEIQVIESEKHGDCMKFFL
ncbi:MAG: Nif3-like dinuclear metal center hexameric protein [Oscillospiraceae bacterium]|nr:Nif3-like dinuclear metal center hexameric protein [Oscillospiraceae bacterium]